MQYDLAGSLVCCWWDRCSDEIRMSKVLVFNGATENELPERLTESQAPKEPVALIPQPHVCQALPRGIPDCLLASTGLVGGRLILKEVVDHGGAALAEAVFAGRGIA